MNELIHNSQDEHYRQARKVFDQMGAIPIWNDNNQAISSIFNIFQQLADEKYGKAFYPLSKLYFSKRNAEDDKEPTNCLADLAFDWCFFSQAIQDVEVWCDLGRMYDEGYGTEQNDEQAVYWFRKAAEQGDSMGQCKLGLMYADGKGVTQNYEEAVKWLRLAAEQGIADAQQTLELIYANGQSTH